MQRMRSLTAATLVGIVALGAVAAGDDESGIDLTATSTMSGSTATVTGNVAFPEAGPESIDAILTEFQGAALTDNAWMGLKDATIETTEEGVRFTWVLDSLPSQPPPEGLRYNWSFAVDGDTYQLQAKTSNVVGTTTADDPEGHLTNIGGTFQVRGNCTTEYMGTPVANCPHIGFVDGSFNTGEGTVTMTVPFGFNDQIQPGIVIKEHQTATMSVAASLQAGVSNTASSQYLNGWLTSYTVGPKVELGVDDPGSKPTSVDYTTAAELSPDGSFSGTIEVPAGSAVFVRACQGFACTAIELG